MQTAPTPNLKRSSKQHRLPKESKIYKKKKRSSKSDQTNDDTTNKSFPPPSADENSRTLFVGNVGVTVKKIHLLKLFQRFGKVKSVRLRGITPAEPGTSKRLAAIKQAFHPKRTSCHSYVVFENREDALKAISLNGTKFKEHFLRVQICDETAEVESSKAIFIGNIPFDAEENDLWNVFENYGKIESVRLVRNSETGMCIGIGFVNFESSDSVELVLMAESIKIKNRNVRIQRYAKTKMKKRVEKNSDKSTIRKVVHKKPKQLKKERPDNFVDKSKSQKVAFQGSKIAKHKKKKKMNKKLLENMKMVKKIAPR